MNQQCAPVSAATKSIAATHDLEKTTREAPKSSRNHTETNQRVTVWERIARTLRILLCLKPRKSDSFDIFSAEEQTAKTSPALDESTCSPIEEPKKQTPEILLEAADTASNGNESQQFIFESLADISKSSTDIVLTEQEILVEPPYTGLPSPVYGLQEGDGEADKKQSITSLDSPRADQDPKDAPTVPDQSRPDLRVSDAEQRAKEESKADVSLHAAPGDKLEPELEPQVLAPEIVSPEPLPIQREESTSHVKPGATETTETEGAIGIEKLDQQQPHEGKSNNTTSNQNSDLEPKSKSEKTQEELISDEPRKSEQQVKLEQELIGTQESESKSEKSCEETQCEMQQTTSNETPTNGQESKPKSEKTRSTKELTSEVAQREVEQTALKETSGEEPQGVVQQAELVEKPASEIAPSTKQDASKEESEESEEEDKVIKEHDQAPAEAGSQQDTEKITHDHELALEQPMSKLHSDQIYAQENTAGSSTESDIVATNDDAALGKDMNGIASGNTAQAQELSHAIALAEQVLISLSLKSKVEEKQTENGQKQEQIISIKDQSPTQAGLQQDPLRRTKVAETAVQAQSSFQTPYHVRKSRSDLVPARERDGQEKVFTSKTHSVTLWISTQHVKAGEAKEGVASGNLASTKELANAVNRAPAIRPSAATTPLKPRGPTDPIQKTQHCAETTKSEMIHDTKKTSTEKSSGQAVTPTPWSKTRKKSVSERITPSRIKIDEKVSKHLGKEAASTKPLSDGEIKGHVDPRTSLGRKSRRSTRSHSVREKTDSVISNRELTKRTTTPSMLDSKSRKDNQPLVPPPKDNQPLLEKNLKGYRGVPGDNRKRSQIVSHTQAKPEVIPKSQYAEEKSKSTYSPQQPPLKGSDTKGRKKSQRSHRGSRKDQTPRLKSKVEETAELRDEARFRISNSRIKLEHDYRMVHYRPMDGQMGSPAHTPTSQPEWRKEVAKNFRKSNSLYAELGHNITGRKDASRTESEPILPYNGAEPQPPQKKSLGANKVEEPKSSDETHRNSQESRTSSPDMISATEFRILKVTQSDPALAASRSDTIQSKSIYGPPSAEKKEKRDLQFAQVPPPAKKLVGKRKHKRVRPPTEVKTSPKSSVREHPVTKANKRMNGKKKSSRIG